MCLANLNSLSGIHYEMMRRCYDPKCVMYGLYGGIGISVCDEWHDRENFKKWAKENGYKTGLKLKRLDSSRGYYPGNCVFCDKNIPSYRKKDPNNVPTYIKMQEEKRKRDELRESYGVPKSFSNLRIYKVYRSMISRCNRKKPDSNPSYDIINKYYISRNITVCDEWKGRIGFYRFYQWSMENGYREGFSIDRIDNEKGYSPDNCRWIPVSDQSKNKRNNVRYDYKGQKLILREICELENISYDALKYRVVKKGQDLDYAISEIKKRRKRILELYLDS